MSRYQLRQGVIIRRHVQPSGDILVTVLSPAKENYPIKWRGLARQGNNLGGNSARLNLFHDISTQIYQKPQQDIATLTQVVLNGALTQLNEPHRYSCAHILAELVDAISNEDSAHHYQFYDYLTSGLRGIAQHTDIQKITIVYAWRLLAQAGLAPRVERCATCDRGATLTHLHVEAGGLSCRLCAKGILLPQETLNEIRALHRCSVTKALTFPFATPKTHWRALHRYISFHVRPLHSLAQARPEL